MPPHTFDAVVYIAGDRQLKPGALDGGAINTVIIDLEDGVATDRADVAREMLPALVADVQAAGARVVVRVNNPLDPAGPADALAVAALPLDVAVLVPKPVTAATLAEVLKLAGQRALWCMGEEPGFSAQVATLKSAFAALETVVVGLKDLAQGLDIVFDLDAPPLRIAANDIRAAAHAAGLGAIDGVAYGESTQLDRSIARARADGFDGISLIRPRDAALVHVF
jgi:citrate lyase subunit beta / citryl-CoA lyase